MIGPVENVVYVNSKEWPCYVSVVKVNSGRNLFYHVASNIEMCKFAERCKERSENVLMRAQIGEASNIINTIEVANTRAKFWFDPKETFNGYY